jgi:lipopolysaccharide/colanic/teichoic acid biosynthesis glycosyltransferase
MISLPRPSIKRTLDIVVSAVGLAALLPVFVAISLAVASSGKGPVIYRQLRVGQCGRPFEILKFRTMVVGAPSHGPQITIGGDPRITVVGHFLRRFKLDEVPQLYNVLKGDMSLVGPRPELAVFVDLYPPVQRDLILSVRPGITDNASLEFHNESEVLANVEDPEAYYRQVILPRKCNLYAQYVKSHTVFGDLLIIARTISLLITHRFARVDGVNGRPQA